MIPAYMLADIQDYLASALPLRNRPAASRLARVRIVPALMYQAVDTKLTLDKSLTTEPVGSAPWLNHHFILPISHCTFFSFGCSTCFADPKTRLLSGMKDVFLVLGIGSYSPSFSNGRPSRALPAGMATMWYNGAFRIPCRDRRIRTAVDILTGFELRI